MSRCVDAVMSEPSESKNLISSDCGSPGTVPTAIPPRDRVVRTWNRVTGTGVTSRSCTWTPDPLTPAINARLIVRDARDASRLITTAAPRFNVVA